MKPGDMVRFKKITMPPGPPERFIGLLIEYHPWEKIARILYDGEIVSVRGENVEKAGKKDFEI